jgi:hypothetical protein
VYPSNNRTARHLQWERQDLLYTGNPLAYVHSLGFHTYEWQARVINSLHKRKTINGARQSGKSTIISAKACHKAKYFPGSLTIILAPNQFQAGLDLKKINDFIGRDKNYPKRKNDNATELSFKNGSEIIILTATGDAARGPSSPDLIILDEASRIEDIVYTSGVRPMLTDNKKCEMVLISTPHGKDGFFYKTSLRPHWERYEIRCPWDVIDLEYRLVPAVEEKAYRARMAEQGIIAYYSPRHFDLDEQQENLTEMGTLMYHQEYCCEYVEPSDQVFNYDDIQAAVNAGDGLMPFMPMAIGEAPALGV